MGLYIWCIKHAVSRFTIKKKNSFVHYERHFRNKILLNKILSQSQAAYELVLIKRNQFKYSAKALKPRQHFQSDIPFHTFFLLRSKFRKILM